MEHVVCSSDFEIAERTGCPLEDVLAMPLDVRGAWQWHINQNQWSGMKGVQVAVARHMMSQLEVKKGEYANYRDAISHLYPGWMAAREKIVLARRIEALPRDLRKADHLTLEFREEIAARRGIVAGEE